jgi:thioredoxin-related protein
VMSLKPIRSVIWGIVVLAGLSAYSATAAELLMFREDGCPWCDKWDKEVSLIYPKTAEGKQAPLRVIDIHEPVDEFISDNGLVHFSPTFVLIDEGREIGRITGYPGEHNFWWLLGELVEKLQ